MKTMLTTVGVLAVAVLLAAQDGDVRTRIDASPGETLELDLDAGGEVRIVGSDTQDVQVEGRVRRSSDPVRILARRMSGGVRVTTEYDRPGRNRSSSIELTVRVPKRFNVELESMGGGVTITDVEGTIRGGTMGGALTLTGLRGQVNLSTMGGGIRLTSSEVDGKVSTMGGNVLIQDVVGNVDGTSMGGNVVQRNVRGADGSVAGLPSRDARFAGKEVRISTMGGDVNVGDAPVGANVSTMGGRIHIGNASGHAKAHTMGGNIRLDSVDGWIEASTMGGDVTAVMTGDPTRGDRHVRLSSLGGSLTLTVPEGLGMRIDVTLAYTRNSRQNYQIRGDVPLQVRETPEWDYSKGSPRRHIYGTATIGNGRHVIVLETINGDVTILKRTR